MSYSFPTLPTMQITQKWGNVNTAMYPAPTYRHMGVDIGGTVGSPIFAACGGVVADVMINLHGYGRSVRIQHEAGAYDTLYAHLHKVYVQIGDAITGGQQIGEMGGQPGDDDPIDGASSGSHLHFEVILPNKPSMDSVKTWAGWTVDPLPFLTERAHGAPKYNVTVVSGKGVRVRTEMNTNAPQIGGLAYLSVNPAAAIHEKGNDRWAELWALRPEYAAVKYAGDILMTVDELEPPVDPPVDPPAVDENAIRIDEIERMIAHLEERKKELE